MLKLNEQLELDRCPHCRVDKPRLEREASCKSKTHDGLNLRQWFVYCCSRCGGAVIAAAREMGGPVIEYYPSIISVSNEIPKTAREYIVQALDSLHAPAGCVMLCSSAVDAMLKAKSYKDGSLYSRINQAAKDNILTQDMAAWAHEVRLDANEQRHSDEDYTLPTSEDAKRLIDFVLVLGEILFVLPSRVQHGIADAKPLNSGTIPN
ncbi:MAG: DUF4145 domain-containing protein [Bacteroidetes bacterium]|nr:DUF4145 domain-containing protein [Bacteroidota bacterium]